MKKLKSQKSTPPISLSAKKATGLKQQMLFTPYKIQWKNVQPATSHQLSSRTFFSTMKSELSNLKNDVEKLIRKENMKAEVNENPMNTSQMPHKKYNASDIKISESRQKKSQVNIQKQDEKILTEAISFQNLTEHQQNDAQRYVFQKISKQLREKQQQIECMAKENRLQKNLINELKKQNHELYKEVEDKTAGEANLVKYYEFEIEKLKEQIDGLNNKNNELLGKMIKLEHQKCKDNHLQTLMKKQEQEKQKLKISNEQLKHHNSFLEEKIEKLSEKVEEMQEKYKEKEQYIKQLQEKLGKMKIGQKQQQTKTGREISHIKEQLTRELKQKQKELLARHEIQISEMEKLYAQRTSRAQKQFKQKEMELAARQQKFMSETEKFYADKIASREKQYKQKQTELVLRYQKQIKSNDQLYAQKIAGIQSKYQLTVKKLEYHNRDLTEKYENLNNQFEKLKQTQSQNNKNTENKQQIDFKLLGAQFENKYSTLLTANYELRNKITSLESDVERLEVEKGTLKEEIRIYEELEKQGKSNNQENKGDQWQKMADELYTLKKQKQDLAEEFELKILRLQNEIQTLKQNKNDEVKVIDEKSSLNIQYLNKILKQQLTQIEKLKQKLRETCKKMSDKEKLSQELEQKVKIIEGQLAIERNKADLLNEEGILQINNPEIKRYLGQFDLLKKKYANLESSLDSRNKQLRAKDDFIEKVLLSKTGKKQQEDDLTYVLREVKLLSNFTKH